MADLTRMAVSASSDDMLRQQVYQFAPLAAQDTTQTAEAVQKPAQAPEDNSQQALNEDQQKNLEQAIEQLDGMLKPLSIGLNVQRVETLNRYYVELMDRDTGEVLREIPHHKIIELQENMRAMQGLLFDKQV